ncbi:hypothetical protein CEUSTIGMA_g546.t1 [Chlamydomonas eustigma]|uniref:Uncharacterized protein n=1 Tax=Chlamydomonas eustigma TaxID=1157962 RepID=A0A250WQJ7_9CHLO|nr:hypothetical protein CEUSTIGMA_g546.t1 [Chlamydomonas eustigma]|eukprot:GAX73093.1 hypothetical protein CEUSTIGMA_g546.t1 [Chlamydomonas eustigma]
MSYCCQDERECACASNQLKFDSVAAVGSAKFYVGLPLPPKSHPLLGASSSSSTVSLTSSTDHFQRCQDAGQQERCGQPTVGPTQQQQQEQQPIHPVRGENCRTLQPKAVALDAWTLDHATLHQVGERSAHHMSSLYPPGADSASAYHPPRADSASVHHPPRADSASVHHPPRADSASVHHPPRADSASAYHPSGADSASVYHPSGADSASVYHHSFADLQDRASTGHRMSVSLERHQIQTPSHAVHPHLPSGFESSIEGSLQAAASFPTHRDSSQACHSYGSTKTTSLRQSLSIERTQYVRPAPRHSNPSHTASHADHTSSFVVSGRPPNHPPPNLAHFFNTDSGSHLQQIHRASIHSGGQCGVRVEAEELLDRLLDSCLERMRRGKLIKREQQQQQQILQTLCKERPQQQQQLGPQALKEQQQREQMEFQHVRGQQQQREQMEFQHVRGQQQQREQMEFQHVRGQQQQREQMGFQHVRGQQQQREQMDFQHVRGQQQQREQMDFQHVRGQQQQREQMDFQHVRGQQQREQMEFQHVRGQQQREQMEFQHVRGQQQQREQTGLQHVRGQQQQMPHLYATECFQSCSFQCQSQQQVESLYEIKNDVKGPQMRSMRASVSSTPCHKIGQQNLECMDSCKAQPDPAALLKIMLMNSLSAAAGPYRNNNRDPYNKSEGAIACNRPSREESPSQNSFRSATDVIDVAVMGKYTREDCFLHPHISQMQPDVRKSAFSEYPIHKIQSHKTMVLPNADVLSRSTGGPGQQWQDHAAGLAGPAAHRPGRPGMHASRSGLDCKADQENVEAYGSEINRCLKRRPLGQQPLFDPRSEREHEGGSRILAACSLGHLLRRDRSMEGVEASVMNASEHNASGGSRHLHRPAVLGFDRDYSQTCAHLGVKRKLMQPTATLCAGTYPTQSSSILQANILHEVQRASQVHTHQEGLLLEYCEVADVATAAPLDEEKDDDEPFFNSMPGEQRLPQQLPSRQLVQAHNSRSTFSLVSCTATVSLEYDAYVSIKIDADAMLDKMTDLFRGIVGASFNSQKHVWTLPFMSLKAAKEELSKVPGLTVRWEGLPDLVCNVLLASMLNRRDISRYEMLQQQTCSSQPCLHERMMQFQRDGVIFGLRRGGRVLIADEMGLGKTVQGCALLRCYQEEWPALIICPSSLRGQWADALKQWLHFPEEDILVVYNVKDAKKMGQASITIVSYDFISKLSEQLMALRFNVILCDEAHYIKNFTSQRCKTALPLLQSSKRALLLTGTPALSRPSELITLIQATLPEAKMKPAEFADRYCEGDRFSQFRGARNQEELNRLLTAALMIRRRKMEVLPQLPSKQRQQVFLQLAASQSAQIKTQFDQLLALGKITGGMAFKQSSSGQLGSGFDTEQLTLLNKLYIDTARVKVPAVQEYVKDLLEVEGFKFLIFAHHKCLLDGIEQQCRKSKVGYIRIDGTTEARSREDLRKEFQENESCRVAVLSIRAAGTGLTLTAASTVVFAELTWVPGEIQQAEDRAHRIGQKDSVNILYLMARNSIDGMIWETIQSKLDNVGKVLDGKEDSLKVVSTQHQLEKGQPGILRFMPACNSRRMVTGSPPLAAIVRDENRVKDQQQQGATSPIPLAIRLRQQQASIHSFLKGEVASGAREPEILNVLDCTSDAEDSLHISEPAQEQRRIEAAEVRAIDDHGMQPCHSGSMPTNASKHGLLYDWWSQDEGEMLDQRLAIKRMRTDI